MRKQEQKLLELLNDVEELDFNLLTSSQIISYIQMIGKVESRCDEKATKTITWAKASNLIRKLDRELKSRVREVLQTKRVA